MTEPKLLRNFTINTKGITQTSSLLQSIAQAKKLTQLNQQINQQLLPPLNQLTLIHLDKYSATFSGDNAGIVFIAKQQTEVILKAFQQTNQTQITHIEIKVL